MRSMISGNQSRADATSGAHTQTTRSWDSWHQHLGVWLSVLMAVMATAAYAANVTHGNAPSAGLAVWPCYLTNGFWMRSCKNMLIVPGSVSGACAEPGMNNPSGDPELVASFNLSLIGAQSVWAPGVRVVVTDTNGTRIGSGNRVAAAYDINAQTQSGYPQPLFDPMSYDLTFECVSPVSKRVFPHAPCSCHAVGMPRDPSIFDQAPTVWDVSYTFAVQSDSGSAVLSYPMQVMCGASYLEVGSRYPDS
jgi:hypothetical protein